MTLQQLTRYSLVLLLSLWAFGSLPAQTPSPAPRHLITGKVINGDNLKVMTGVSVNIKGSLQGTVSDSNGHFSIPIRTNDVVTLLFSYVGYDNKEYKLHVSEGDTTIIITMTNGNKKMDDVVVIGYGTQRRSNILGSVATVNPKDVEDLPVANLSTSLVNQVPGVSIAQTSGKPGATTNMVIRNAATFASGGTTSPLFIIDGLAPIIGTGSGVDPTGQTAFNNLDPSEIESITFLKDASATIYGARGANGVVLVTTKKGKAGPPRINYSGSYSDTRAAHIPTMIDGYNQAMLLNNYVENYRTNDVVTTEIYTPQELDTIKSRNFNWFKDEWIPNGSIQRHTVSVSGGTEKLTYFAGGNYYDEIGNLPEVVQTKYGIQLGMTARIVDGLNVSVTVNDNTGYNNRPAPKGTTTTEQTDQLNATIGGLLSVPRWVPESYQGNPFYYSPLGWNPIALAASNSYSKDNSENFSVNTSVTYQLPFLKGLSVQGQYGRNTYNDYAKQYYPSYNTYEYTILGDHKDNSPGTNIPTGTQGVLYNYDSYTLKTITNGNQLSIATTNSVNWQATEGISYANHFGQHSVSATLLTEQEQTTGNYEITTNEGQVIPNNDQIYGFNSSGSDLIVSGQQLSTGRVSYLGRLDYNFMGRYLFEGAFRDDASPNFPTNKQWGFFPSASVGWKISEEKFFEDHVHFLNDLKIRFNMGLTGNDAVSSFGWVQRFTSTNGYLFGNTATNGLSTSSVPNPDITWERDLYKDLGFDGTLANRRISFTLDYWYRHQYDMLDAPTASVPVTFGSTITDYNYGTLNSWGTEASVTYRQDLNKNWQVFATVNFSWSDNKVVKEYYSAGTDTGYLNPIGKRVDRGITGYKSTGIVRSAADAAAWNAKHPGWLVNGDTLRAGDLNFKDLNGDGQVTSLDQTQIAKRSSTIAGFGFILGAQWKGFRLTTNISLGLGGQMVWPKVDITPPTKDVSSLSMWKGSYTVYNTNSKLPAIYAPFNNQASTFWLHSATYMYVNNMMLTWQVPVSWTAAHHMPEFRVYITGNNLWSIIDPTPYRDPRSNEITDYPILRNYTFGLNINI